MESFGTSLGDDRVTSSSPTVPPRRSSDETPNGSPGSSQPYRASGKARGTFTHRLIQCQAQDSSRSTGDQTPIRVQHEVELSYHPAEAFRQYVDTGLGAHKHKGFNGKGEAKVFVCRPALEEYWTHKKIGAVLDRDRNTDANVEDIRTNFLQVFSILCYISRSSYINYFMTREVDDKCLLASPAKQRGPLSDDAGFSNVWLEAYKAQWKFKPLTFDSIVHRRELPMERILPIVYETRLTPPASDEAAVYKVSVHPCCMDPTMRSIVNSNELVFKMFNPGHIDDIDLWQNEINAYNVIVNSPGGSLSSGTSSLLPDTAIASSAFDYIVRYLGSFMWTQQIDTANSDEYSPLNHDHEDPAIVRNDLRGRTQIIMLEYAPGGTLVDFCEQQLELIMSRARRDRLDLWYHLFQLLQALAAVHNLGGTHQDIRASNVLYMRKDGSLGSRERPCFKLADFGRSHFKRITGSGTDSVDTNKSGPGTYSKSNPRARGANDTLLYTLWNCLDLTPHSVAPECCGANEVEQAIPRPYTKAADIWALGCLYSEMLVRSSLGSDGVRRYRDARRSENQGTIMRRLAEQCFHDGTKRLSCVEQFHQGALTACPGDEVLQAASDPSGKTYG
ncbi:kinase-like protein [Canariomyces notabilis]|uniref:Kinase-like protein n=1 Tax=Canariomyces notabilis TaxID=2074819 RepID=A0AAN6TNL9_9PEZI|nr:kinase-like protein [Canariomyces arenarius]